MRKLYQKEWFGIDFRSLATLDSKRLADTVFYDKFYDEFYKKFPSFEELPDDWKRDKKLIADFILKLSNNNERILSIGCGNGYIEYLVRKEGRNITAIEPSAKATKFLRQFSDVKLYEGYFPKCLDDTSESFDLAWMSTIEYVFDEKELLQMLNDIRDYGIRSLLLVSVAVYGRYSIMPFIKHMAMKVLSLMRLRELGQFWGYVRTPEELIKAFIKAGFKDIESGFFKKGYFWTKGTL
jgi:SAM-dependent methyltransferase